MIHNLSTKTVNKTVFKSILFIICIQFLALFALQVNAATCVSENANGRVINYGDDLETCVTHVLITKEEFDSFSINKDEIIETLKELFEFSAADFALFNGMCIVAWIGGHALGRVVRIFGKS